MLLVIVCSKKFLTDKSWLQLTQSAKLVSRVPSHIIVVKPERNSTQGYDQIQTSILVKWRLKTERKIMKFKRSTTHH